MPCHGSAERRAHEAGLPPPRGRVGAHRHEAGPQDEERENGLRSKRRYGPRDEALHLRPPHSVTISVPVMSSWPSPQKTSQRKAKVPYLSGVSATRVTSLGPTSLPDLELGHVESVDTVFGDELEDHGLALLQANLGRRIRKLLRHDPDDVRLRRDAARGRERREREGEGKGGDVNLMSSPCTRRLALLQGYSRPPGVARAASSLRPARRGRGPSSRRRPPWRRRRPCCRAPRPVTVVVREERDPPVESGQPAAVEEPPVAAEGVHAEPVTVRERLPAGERRGRRHRTVCGGAHGRLLSRRRVHAARSPAVERRAPAA